MAKEVKKTDELAAIAKKVKFDNHNGVRYLQTTTNYIRISSKCNDFCSERKDCEPCKDSDCCNNQPFTYIDLKHRITFISDCARIDEALKEQITYKDEQKSYPEWKGDQLLALGEANALRRLTKGGFEDNDFD